jgi:hypothetical protein
MNTDTLVIIATILIGYMGVFVMLSQINTRIDDLRTDFKSELNSLEIKLNTLLMGLFRDYYRPIFPPTSKEDDNAA